MKFGYARVSKNEQNLDIQLQKLQQAGCDEIFQEKVSGSKDDRSQLNSLLNKLRAGDILYVVRLDRLGRRMSKLVELINDFKERDINNSWHFNRLSMVCYLRNNMHKCTERIEMTKNQYKLKGTSDK